MTSETEAEPIEGEVVGEEIDPPETSAAEQELSREASEKLALVRAEEPLARVGTLPSPREWEASMAIAKTIARTSFVPASLRGKPESVVAAILVGRELGIGPMEALKQVHIIDGRPALAAELMLALMRRGGVKIVETEETPERASITAERGDTGERMTVTWTVADAEAAGITRKDNWRKYPADMLWARCVGRLARRLAPDLVAGYSYSAEEVRDFDADGNSFEESGYGGSGAYDEALAPSDVRRDREEVAPPRSTAAVIARIGEIDPDGDLGIIDYWIPEALIATFGKQKRSELSQAQKTLCDQKLASMVVKLGQEPDFPPPDRETIGRAFAFAFDGMQLTGPPWRLSPKETDRPVREKPAGDAASAPSAPAEEEAEAESPPGETQAESASEEADRIADETFQAPK
jgi:hypothetical protein